MIDPVVIIIGPSVRMGVKLQNGQGRATLFGLSLKNGERDVMIPAQGDG